jgi:RNA polymerase sigma-70 factor (ECF subfamily)
MDFSGLYTRYARDVHRFAVWLSGDPVFAEDLTAETFVHALCASTPLRLDTVKAYLFAITHNLYQDFTERQRRLRSMGGVHEPADPAPSTQSIMENRQAVDKVLQAIQRLPKPLREALVLAIDGDLRYEQIAAILGCSVGAVKVRIHRARLQLKADLGAQENKTCKE